MEVAFERARERTRAAAKIKFPQMNDDELDSLLADAENREIADIKRQLLEGQAKMAQAHPELSEKEQVKLSLVDYLIQHPESMTPVMAAILAASKVSAAAGEAAAGAARAAIERDEIAARHAQDAVAVGGKRKKAIDPEAATQPLDSYESDDDQNAKKPKKQKTS